MEFWLENMTEMMIDTRPTYPSSKLTFTIANITKDKAIRFFNIYLTLNGTFDVDVVLEDSKRNFLNSFILISFSLLLIFALNLIIFFCQIGSKITSTIDIITVSPCDK